MKRSTAIASLVVLAGLVTGTVMVAAGPLNPSAGAVGPTFKTLTEVEPRTAISLTNTPGDASSVFRINSQGSYYLTGNVSVPSGKTGILIATDGVTIDLNGFSIVGPNSTVSGIAAAFSCLNIVVKNGTVRGVGSVGVNLGNCPGSQILGMNAQSCMGGGFKVTSGTTVRETTASNCGAGGFISSGDCSFLGCTSNGNAQGFDLLYGSNLAESCIADYNLGDGFATNNSILTRCVADSNGTNGFESSFGDRLTNCRAGYNGNTGFVGIGNCVVESCTAVENEAAGFNLGHAATIRNSFSEGNYTQGIKVGDSSVVTGNQVRYNGNGMAYAGIWLSGSQATADGNQSTGNGYGLYVTGAGNMVMRNSCGTNSSANYLIPVGNRVGLITAGTTNAAINGSSGGGLGFTDPYVNIAF